MDTKIILGPPGTGKTTRLLDILETELKNGIDPNRIAFCSFTKKAVEEAITRTCQRFNYSERDLPYFRTIHSLAFNSLGLSKTQVMQREDYTKIGKHLGLKFSGKWDFTDGPAPIGKNPGDYYLFIEGLSKTTRQSYKNIWDSMDHTDLHWFEFKRFTDTVEDYKRSRMLYDYSDMLLIESRAFDVDVLIIDEAQDLSAAQWYFINNAFKKVKRRYIGGDDDQAIFEWSGADVNTFINLQGKKEVLHQSYRVPTDVHSIATSISSRISNRETKAYLPRDLKGSVNYWRDMSAIDMSSGTWLLLTRNSYLLNELGATVKHAGYPFSVKDLTVPNKTHITAIKNWEHWRKGKELCDKEIQQINEFVSKWDKNLIWHIAFDKLKLEDREYYISLLRKGENLSAAPRIRLSTIHGVKGGEADNVVLLTDMAYNTWNAVKYNPDSENRVWYVGATRAKENLHIVLPRGRYGYDM